jgi:NADH-quinone oxidoreductase subunit F
MKAKVSQEDLQYLLPADLILKRLMEDRLMTYESLSDGGFATGSDVRIRRIVYDDTACIVRNTGISPVFITMSPWAMYTLS